MTKPIFLYAAKLCQVAGLLCLILWSVIPQQVAAAEITLLPRNPYADESVQPVFLDGMIRDGFWAVGAFGSANSLTEARENNRFKYINGIGLDGAATQMTRRWVPTATSLRQGRVLRIKGRIETGDVDRLDRLIRQEGLDKACYRAGYCPYSHVLMLDSPGGNLAEAVRLYDLVQRYELLTVVGPKARCESACFLVFAAGFTKWGNIFFHRRFAHPTSRIGVHRPDLTVPAGAYSADQVVQATNVLLESVSATTERFASAGLSASLLQRLFQTPASQMHRMTPVEMAQERIVLLDDAPQPTRLTRASAFALCADSYVAAYNDAPDGLIDNMLMDQQSFITFDPGLPFVCAGVFDSEQYHNNEKTQMWTVLTCRQQACAFDDYWEYNEYSAFIEDEDAEMFAINVTERSLGTALREYAHRSVLLRLIRDAHAWRGWEFVPVTLEIDALSVPQAYCGRLDAANPGLVRQVQAGLNAQGFAAGVPDGSPGFKTREAIRAAQERLLPQARADGRVTVALLDKLGVSRAQQARYTFCDPAYRG